MSRLTDPGHFFQTDASDATRARRAAKAGNKNGSPIKLQSKILDVILDPFSHDCVYVAESAGCVRKVNIKNRDAKTVYRGPNAPVTSVAIGGLNGETVFAGCWDKEIWSWDRLSLTVARRYKGHSDFVKTILCCRISGRDILISGGADAKLMVWDTATGTRLHVLRSVDDSMLAIQHLALDPVQSDNDTAVVFSASSDPSIRSWKISTDAASSISGGVGKEPAKGHSSDAFVHDTSIYRLRFDVLDGSDGDLWTASADGSCKRLSRERHWEVEETFVHSDYVRDVVTTVDCVITAGRDENVKVWAQDSGKLSHVYEGHYEEVTGLVLMENLQTVISVSIDGTVRTWMVDSLSLTKARNEKAEADKGVEMNSTAKPTKPALTEEEEAELAELMSDTE